MNDINCFSVIYAARKPLVTHRCSTGWSTENAFAGQISSGTREMIQSEVIPDVKAKTRVLLQDYVRAALYAGCMLKQAFCCVEAGRMSPPQSRMHAHRTRRSTSRVQQTWEPGGVAGHALPCLRCFCTTLFVLHLLLVISRWRYPPQRVMCQV